MNIKAMLLLVVVSMLCGCATVGKTTSASNQAQAVVIFAQAFDEIFGCPLDISRKTGREPTEESCKRN